MTLQTRETSPATLRERTIARSTRALGSGASRLAEKAELDRGQRTAALLTALPGYIDAQHHLDSGDIQDKAEKREHTKTAIEFNSILHGIADHDASMRVGTLQNMVWHSHDIRTGNISPATAWKNVSRAIRGMRHETAFDGVTCYIDGVEDIRNGSVTEDMYGIDKVVTYKDTKIKVDVKASPYTALRALQGDLEHNNFTSLPIWSGFTEADFGDKLRVTNDAAMSRPAPYVEDVFECAYQYGNAEALHMLEQIYTDMIEQSEESVS